MLNAYFVSDIHIGSPDDTRAVGFLEFLRGLRGGNNATHLFLMGDIFDLWIAAHVYFVDRYAPIVAEVVRLRDEGVEIHYFEGNHDLYLRHYWGDELGIEVHEGASYFRLGRFRVRVEHGDQMDPDDRGYRFLRWFLRTPPLKFLLPRLPSSFVVRLGEHASVRSRVYTSEVKTISRDETIRVIRAHAKKAYAEAAFDLIISGHVHVRDHVSVDEEGMAFESVNLGSWLDAPCYYRIDGQGHRLVELHDGNRQYSGDELSV